ncbi:MAG: hypothetical protein ACREE4_23070 [Stellaceae bacterium]
MPHQNSVFHAMLKRLPWEEMARLSAAHGIARRQRGFTAKTQRPRRNGQDALGGATAWPALGGNPPARDRHRAGSHAAQSLSPGDREVCRSTLSEANAHRPSEFCADLLALLMQRVRRSVRRRLDGITDLIAAARPHRAQRRVGAVFGVCGAKAPIISDPDADQPVYAQVSAATVNDITAATAMPIVAGATSV